MATKKETERQEAVHDGPKLAPGDTIPATVHCYWIGDRRTDEYRALSEKLEGLGPEKFAAIGPNDADHFARKIKPLDGQVVYLETKHLFSNQWNTAPTPTSESGLRVFDWSEPINIHNRKLAYGYWLEYDLEEVRNLRASRLQCGYCGRQTQDHGDGFCHDCMGSEYLGEADLHMLRLLPVAESFGGNRAPLTDEERAALVPELINAQIHGNTEREKQRVAKARQDIKEERDKVISDANAKFDGMTWLMDHGVNTSNVIYYSHTGRFCFGWRKKYSKAEAEALRIALQGFTWPHDIQEA